MFLAHGPASYIANELIQKKEISNLKYHEQIIVGILSFLFGILPDVDLLVLLMTDIPPFRHHEIFSHTPIFYISLWLILVLTSKGVRILLNKKSSKFLNGNFIDVILKTFLISTLVHLLMDLVVNDVMIFYPISDKPFTLLKYVLEPTYKAGYLLSTGFSLEILIVSIFVKLITEKYLQTTKLLKTATTLFIISSIIYVIFTFSISRFTYNRSYLYDGNNRINHDIDYDTLLDSNDSNIGNNGENNLYDIDKELLSKNARAIVESSKLTNNGNIDIFKNIKSLYGGLDSAGIVTQAFYQSHKPLTPVLRDFYTQEYQHGYKLEYRTENLLYEFLKKDNSLLELNTKATFILPEGKIFFVKNRNNEISNIGITLDNNCIATVLEYDNVLQLHTYTELKSKIEEGSKIEIQE